MKRAFGAGFGVLSRAALSRVAGAFLMVGVLASLWSASLLLYFFADGLVALSITIGTVALVTSYTITHHRETLVRRCFGQRLAPAVVRRIFETPGALRHRGERCEIREITALFTDLEGFTAMTRRADPAALVAILDNYFEEWRPLSSPMAA
jgi:adenylate cyclase